MVRVAMFCAGSLACWGGPPHPTATPLPPNPLVLSAERPLIVKPEVSDEVRAVLAGKAETPLRLTVSGLSIPTGTGARVRVFINTPSASADTETSAAGFVGSINFSHDPETAADFHLDPGKAFERLRVQKKFDPNTPVEVTLVLLPLRPGKPERQSPSATVEQVKIEIAHNDRR